MAKSWFNEAEVYLLNNWSEVQLLEQSVNEARTKYKAIFDKVLDNVSARHGELDRRANRLAARDWSLVVGIGKNTWPCGDSSPWLSGLWLGDVRLEDLTSEATDPPYAAIWIKPTKDAGVDLTKAADKLSTAATQMQLVHMRVKEPIRSNELISYPLPETRQVLRELLLADEAGGFIDCMVAHFTSLAKFIPAIDEIFRTGMCNR